ncbi:MAG TPA: hypothetical protein VHV29_15065 [Terriglobales bacterium]|nr:hypothetical protein [Terriglobales bacterium]
MTSRSSIFVLGLLMAVPVWSQTDANTTSGPSPAASDSQMAVPAPISAQNSAGLPDAEARSNYLRTGLTFISSYSDNLLGGASTRPVGDESYSVMPYIALDETTSRLHSVLNFDPGFTFYQHTSDRNEADENGGLNVSYRFTPHVTVSVVDSFRKSSNLLNQPDAFSDPTFGSAQASPVTVFAPVADQLSNSGTVQATYQFAPNAMVGVSGTFTNLHYSNPAQVPGLYDSGSRGGSAFYTHRLSGRHYIGATYQYQMLLAYPVGFRSQTTTNGLMLFYSIYLKPTVSLSFFGGPQYSDTEESIAPPARAWSPAAGVSLSWRERQTTFGVSYSRMIAPSGGLIGAVHQDQGALSIRRHLTRSMSAELAGQYANNQLLAPALLQAAGGFNEGGHSISGFASLDRQLGEHLALSLGYSRLHQSYSDIAAVSNAPDTNRGWLSISYQFAKPLGR